MAVNLGDDADTTGAIYGQIAGAYYGEKGISDLWVPVRDVSVPSKDGMVMILDRIDQALAQQRPVYVHCWGGKGRTGTVVGCYLVRHGIAEGEAALKAIQKMRRNDPKAHEPSPETREQCDFVLRWEAEE